MFFDMTEVEGKQAVITGGERYHHFKLGVTVVSVGQKYVNSSLETALLFDDGEIQQLVKEGDFEWI